MSERMCFGCGNENIVRLGNVFIPGEGNYAVYRCAECGDIWNEPIYDVDDTSEIEPVKITGVNPTFGK